MNLYINNKNNENGSLILFIYNNEGLYDIHKFMMIEKLDILIEFTY